MKCPNCGYSGLRYDVQKTENIKKKALARKLKRLPRRKWVGQSKEQEARSLSHERILGLLVRYAVGLEKSNDRELKL